jgi:integrase
MKKEIRLCDYFKDWMETYKKPLVSPATYVKYTNTHKQIQKYFGDSALSELNASNYQKAINEYAQTRAKLTVSCFHKQIRACLLDAIDEGIITIDPARKTIITGRKKESTKRKYLDYAEWKKIVSETYFSNEIKDQVIYISAVTGMRYAEVLGLTWDNIDYDKMQIEVNKSWDYKYHQGFIGTKNKSSERRIDIDKQTLEMLNIMMTSSSDDNHNNLVFHYTAGKQLYSTCINNYLSALCLKLDIAEISYHSLRHSHSSVMLYRGISIMAISKRLGHSNVTTTQAIYMHIIKEMEERERDSIISTIDAAFIE